MELVSSTSTTESIVASWADDYFEEQEEKASTQKVPSAKEAGDITQRPGGGTSVINIYSSSNPASSRGRGERGRGRGKTITIKPSRKHNKKDYDDAKSDIQTVDGPEKAYHRVVDTSRVTVHSGEFAECSGNLEITFQEKKGRDLPKRIHARCQSYSYKEGLYCQTCHMINTKGYTSVISHKVIGHPKSICLRTVEGSYASVYAALSDESNEFFELFASGNAKFTVLVYKRSHD